MHAGRSVLVKLAAVGVVAVAALTGAASASAGTNWSVGIAVPGVVVSGGESGYYQPAPVYAPPAPVYYRPDPVYRAAPPVAYAPAPVYYEPGYRGEGRRFYRSDWEGGRRSDRRDWRHERHEERRGWGDRD